MAGAGLVGRDPVRLVVVVGRDVRWNVMASRLVTESWDKGRAVAACGRDKARFGVCRAVAMYWEGRDKARVVARARAALARADATR